MNVIPIEKSYIKSPNYLSVIDRYYKPRYALNVRENNDDYCILIHSNRVCVLTLATSHNILRMVNKIDKISFSISDDILNKVSGKKKRGAHQLLPTSSILTAECNGKQYSVCSAISGKLLEVNKQLIDNPNLLIEDPQGKGYIAIIMPLISLIEHYKEHLMKYDEYKLISQNK